MSSVPHISADYHADDALVSTLNLLLETLHLTIRIETPYDLTPSLLLAILESIQQSRLPIAPAIRESRDFPSKVQAMKVFLGLLENDVLQMDVGLSEVDPRRLAAGEWSEVVFMGELLCWLGRCAGILPRGVTAAGRPGSTVLSENITRDAPPVARPRTASPSTHSTITTSIHSYLSLSRSAPAGSDTTVLSMASEPHMPLPELGLFDTPAPPTPPEPSTSESFAPPTRPRCIHEVEDGSFIRHLGYSDSFASDAEPDETSSCCDCPTDIEDTAPPLLPPPRRSGWINRADDSSELRSHTASHRAAQASYVGLAFNPRRRPSSSKPSGVLTRHNSPTQYTLALLNERAKLLAELAAIKPSPKRG
ncbi:hypothetical protein B0H21DRAFT_205146 [Amylocystis lapponica]|nr:hypothetical protein B0H21DRAFT_205146 [Amylocystis lapponica]